MKATQGVIPELCVHTNDTAIEIIRGNVHKGMVQLVATVDARLLARPILQEYDAFHS